MLSVLSQISSLRSRYVSRSLFPSIHSLSVAIAVNFKNYMLLSSRVFVCKQLIPFFMGQKQGKGVLMHKNKQHGSPRCKDGYSLFLRTNYLTALFHRNM